MSNFWTVGLDGAIVGIQHTNTTKDYPINFDKWLLDIGDTYLSHSIDSVEGITITSHEYLTDLTINGRVTAGRYIVVWGRTGSAKTRAKFTITLNTTLLRTETLRVELRVI